VIGNLCNLWQLVHVRLLCICSETSGPTTEQTQTITDQHVCTWTKFWMTVMQQCLRVQLLRTSLLLCRLWISESKSWSKSQEIECFINCCFISQSIGTLLRLRRVVAVLSLRWPGFDPSEICGGRGTIGTYSIWVSPVRMIAPVLRTHSCHRSYVTLATDSGVTL
jgi:hypothetical protein